VQAVVVRRVAAWFSVIRKLGPYMVLEIVLPGGTLIALLLFLYQRRQLTDGAVEMPAVAWAIGAVRTAYKRVLCSERALELRGIGLMKDQRTITLPVM
jgi:hypothetical protein